MKTPAILALFAVCIVAALGAFFFFRGEREVNTPSAFRLNEFGVEVIVPAELRGVSYAAKEEQFGTTLHVSSGETEDSAGHRCELGVFLTIPKDDIPPDTAWTRERLEAARGEIDGAPAQVKEFTNFYLVFEPSRAACARSERQAEREREERTALWQSLTSARFIQF